MCLPWHGVIMTALTKTQPFITVSRTSCAMVKLFISVQFSSFWVDNPGMLQL